MELPAGYVIRGNLKISVITREGDSGTPGQYELRSCCYVTIVSTTNWGGGGGRGGGLINWQKCKQWT